MRITQVFILQLGLAFVFIAFGIDKFVHPDAWIGYIPFWIQFETTLFLYAIGIFEILLGALLLVQKTSRIAAIGCAAFLAVIIFTLGWNEITIRDIGLLAMALSLCIQPGTLLPEEQFRRRRR